MPVRVFSVEQREAHKANMLQAGVQLIRQHGMTHASVEKITQAAGLGKSTFYNFFASKEQFVLEIIAYQRDQTKQRFDEVLAGRDRMTAEEGKAYLKGILLNDDTIYQYLTPEDERKLRAAVPDYQQAQPEGDSHIMASLLAHMQGVRADVDMKLVANLIKMIALAMFHRDQMHQAQLEATFDRVFDLVFACVFE